MKKFFIMMLVIGFLSSCCVFAAKYTINSSGVIKSPTGNIVSPQANVINQNYNYFNNYSAQNYVNSNIVNANSVGKIGLGLQKGVWLL